MIRRLLHILTRREIRAASLGAGASYDRAAILVRRRWRRPLLVTTTRAELVSLAEAIVDRRLTCADPPQTITPTTTREDTDHA